MTAWGTAAGLAWMLLVCCAGTAGAQTLPSEPISIAGGRVTLGGDVSATIGPEDPGFFTYTDYDHSALRMLRVDLSAAVKAGPHFTVLGEVRTENFGQVRPYALYVRIRPWTARNFDIQVGRVPPTFGAFARRTYASDNPLIGYPLAYQYMTTMRADALAANVDELLRKRSLGWLFRYSVGRAGGGGRRVAGQRLSLGHRRPGARHDGDPQRHGVGDRRDGVEPALSRRQQRPSAGRTHRAASRQRPDRRRLAGARSVPRPRRGARGIGQRRRRPRQGLHADRVGRRPRVLARSLPAPVRNGRAAPGACRSCGTPALPQPLGALSTSVEGRYKLRPGLYAAARFDHLGFSEVVGTRETLPWDAPVTRVEVGGGYSLQRNLLLKLSYQHNRRDGGVLVRVAHLGAAQLVFWF